MQKISAMYRLIQETREGQIGSEVLDIEEEGPSESSRQVRERSSVLLWLLVIASVLFFPPLGLASVYLVVTARNQFKNGNYVGAKARAQLSQILATVAMVIGAVWIGLVVGLVV